MDKQARLSSILSAMKEHQESSEQAQYGIQLALITKEWGHIIRCAEKLISIENLNAQLSFEAKHLQEQIEDEAKEVIL